MPDVYTLNDLVSREVLDAGEAKPARLAVIGCPIAHSASPGMQQAALDAAGIAARYVRIEVAPGRVGEACERMRALGFIGCNVTVPHKLAVMAACDEVEAAAMTLGAVNTVSFEATLTRGFNTDGPGFVSALADEFGIALAKLKVVILGAGGGAGQALAAQCAMQGVARLVLVNRTVAKLGLLASRLRALAPGCEIQARSFDDPALAETCLASDLLVNTSTVGLLPGEPSILPESCLQAGQLVYDCIYQSARTPLLELAAAKGCRHANGRAMLIHQGALAFQHWFPQSAPLAVMRAALG
ncbi:MAG: shikimate dehydrogenase [Verrucomicrobia bacterium]|nr:shikimate dehydrogenase [Verrucomicrobiota bacterium]